MRDLRGESFWLAWGNIQNVWKGKQRRNKNCVQTTNWWSSCRIWESVLGICPWYSKRGSIHDSSSRFWLWLFLREFSSLFRLRHYQSILSIFSPIHLMSFKIVLATWKQLLLMMKTWMHGYGGSYLLVFFVTKSKIILLWYHCKKSGFQETSRHSKIIFQRTLSHISVFQCTLSHISIFRCTLSHRCPLLIILKLALFRGLWVYELKFR